ncbi:RNA polymerase-associated protein rtf1 [Sorochytrium milnesiophthora]
MADDTLKDEILALVEGGAAATHTVGGGSGGGGGGGGDVGSGERSSRSSKSRKRKRDRKKRYSDSEHYSSSDSRSDSARDSGSDRAHDDDDDDDEEDEDDDVDDDEWGSDFMGDDEDREYLMSLPELEREQILSERAEKRQMRIEKQELRRKLRQSSAHRKSSSHKSSSSSRSRDKKYKDSFAVLRKKREEKKKRAEERDSSSRRKRKRKSSRRSDRSDSDSDHHHRRHHGDDRKKKKSRNRSSSPASGKPRRRRHRSASSDSSGRSSDSDESDRSQSRSRSRSRDKSKSRRKEKQSVASSQHGDSASGAAAKSESKQPELLTLEDIQKIVISRDQLERWCFAPFFDATVKQAFVKIRIGVDPKSGQSQYRLAQITAQDVLPYKRAYTIQRSQTDKCLLLKHGKAEKQFLMDIVSNAPVTEAEFLRWKSTCAYENIDFVSLRQIERKQRDIQQAIDHVFTKEELNDIVKAKQQLSGASRNLAVERTVLYRERDEALSRGDTAKLEEVQQKIAEVDDQIERHRGRHREPQSAAAAGADSKKGPLRSRQFQRVEQGQSTPDPAGSRESASPHVQAALELLQMQAKSSSPAHGESQLQSDNNSQTGADSSAANTSRDNYQDMFASLSQLVDIDI